MQATRLHTNARPRNLHLEELELLRFVALLALPDDFLLKKWRGSGLAREQKRARR
jgi:hypothetical protein